MIDGNDAWQYKKRLPFDIKEFGGATINNEFYVFGKYGLMKPQWNRQLLNNDSVDIYIWMHVISVNEVFYFIRMYLSFKWDKIRDLFKVKLYTIRSETKKERER